jgi:hypothetical protein
MVLTTPTSLEYFEFALRIRPVQAAVAIRWALEALDLTIEQSPLAFISHLEQILNEDAHGRVASQVPL